MLLTDDERLRFTEYLDLESESAKGIAEQMEKLAGPAGQVLAKQERLYAAAARLIADRLRSTDSFVVSGPRGETEL